MTNKRFRRNMLVAYQGGGYDGCVWEWNYAYFDENLKFHNIFSSGYNGCSTEEQMREFFRNAPNDVKLVNLDSKRARNDFADTESIKGVVRCARWFSDNNIDVAIRPKCSCCDERFDAAEGHPEGWHGIGGIEMAPSELLCHDCFEQHSCGDCGEYYGPDYKFVLTDESSLCEYCAKDACLKETTNEV